MTLILSGTSGLSDVDGSAATPAIRGTDTNTGIFFPAADTIGFAEGGTEAMRIDSSGNVGIGTSSPVSRCHIANTDNPFFTAEDTGSGTGYFGQNLSVTTVAAESTIAFRTGASYGNPFGSGSERMRIDSSGNLLVGTTSSQAKLTVYGTAVSNTGVGSFWSTSASDIANPAGSFVKYDNNSTTSQIFVKFGINQYGSGSGQINANGANAAAFGSFSDRRLKENIVDLPSQLANIMALRPVEFDYIESEGGGHQIGFIAQEVQEVYSDLVGERLDGMLTLSDLNKNDARLIKCIQEQQAIITQLQADVAALKAQP